MLNRHSEIFAGPETALFAYPQLYKKWNRYKPFLLTKGVAGVKSTGWAIRNGWTIQPEYGWANADLQKTILRSPSFTQFVTAFYAPILRKYNKKYWVEKTPVNACGFQAFLDHFPKGKVIHPVRNPYDTVASLISRGMSAYQAAAYYLYNTSHAISCKSNPRYYEISYENLVKHSKKTLEQLFLFMNIPFEENIIEAKYEKRSEPTQLDGWKSDETAKISKSSIGRFQELPDEIKESIHAAFNTIEISPKHLEKYNLKAKNIATIADVLNYEYNEVCLHDYHAIFKKERFKDMLHRTYRLHPTHFFNYPICLKK